MTRKILLLALQLSWVLLAAPNYSAAAETVDSELFQGLEARWNQAHLAGDVDALDKLWAPDITVIVPGMQPFTKGEMLGMWRSMKVRFTEYATSDVVIHPYGKSAVVTGLLKRSRDFGGRTATENWRFTKTYALTTQGWQVVSYHASELPPAR